MKPYFIDTHAFIALLDPSDPHHAAADAALGTKRFRFVTSEWVLTELADGFSRPPGREVAVRQIAAVRSDPTITVVPHDGDVYAAAYGLFTARPDKAWSLTDCTSFVIMSARGLTDALTADRHFAQAGFRPIFANP